jgi:hypothetical protein
MIKTCENQLTKSHDLVLKERALNELMLINDEIKNYEASKVINYQELPYRHSYNCIFPNG